MENQELQPINNKYHNSKVYKLQADDGYYYFGSTAQKYLSARYIDHKRNSKTKQIRKIYTIFTYDRFVNCEIKIGLVEEFKLENKQQLLREENKYIQQHLSDPFCLNSMCAIRSYEEKAEYNKIYRQNNIEKYVEYEKVRVQTEKRKLYTKLRQQLKYTCICGSTISIPHKSEHKKSIKHQEFINKQQE